MNQAINIIFTIISAVLIMYMVLILLRVLSTWFSGGTQSGFLAILGKVTDPFLNLFRKIKFLKLQYLDLSPIVAIIALQILITICSRIANEHAIWFGLILSILIEMIGGAITFFFLMFLILAGVRLIGIFAHVSSVSRVWFTLDHLLQPLVYPIITRISPNRVIPYGTGLGIFMGLNLAAWFVGNLLFNQLSWLARGIPF